MEERQLPCLTFARARPDAGVVHARVILERLACRPVSFCRCSVELTQISISDLATVKYLEGGGACLTASKNTQWEGWWGVLRWPLTNRLRSKTKLADQKKQTKRNIFGLSK